MSALTCNVFSEMRRPASSVLAFLTDFDTAANLSARPWQVASRSRRGKAVCLFTFNKSLRDRLSHCVTFFGHQRDAVAVICLFLSTSRIAHVPILFFHTAAPPPSEKKFELLLHPLLEKFSEAACAVLFWLRIGTVGRHGMRAISQHSPSRFEALARPRRNSKVVELDLSEGVRIMQFDNFHCAARVTSSSCG